MELLRTFIASQTRIKLLNLFTQNPNKQYYIRQIARLTGENYNAVWQELNNLQTAGFLVTETHPRRKFYSVNQDFLIYPELSSIVAKAGQVS